jgi:perosamine synthetase
MTAFIPVSKPSIGESEVAKVLDAVQSGWVSSLGPYIAEFEKRFAEFCGTRYALTASNGTTALHLALSACGVQRGHEVIVPDLTFIATANAVTYTGATPVMVDIDAETLCISPAAIERAITPRTRAIMPVHLYGHPADMDAIRAIAAKHDLVVIEDAAEAHGAEYRGKRVGSLGLCGVFSFFGNKIITSGEGGMITTDSKTLHETARRLRSHAMSPSRRYWHDEIGYNYCMTNLQAALGLAQLERIDEILAKRSDIMGWYREELEGRWGLRLNRNAPWGRSAHWMVCLEVEGMDDAKRQAFMASLRSRGVDSRPYFYPISDMPMYPGAMTPVAHRLSPIGINLPTYVDLTREDVAHIGRQVSAALDELSARNDRPSPRLVGTGLPQAAVRNVAQALGVGLKNWPNRQAAVRRKS